MIIRLRVDGLLCVDNIGENQDRTAGQLRVCPNEQEATLTGPDTWLQPLLAGISRLGVQRFKRFSPHDCSSSMRQC